MLCILYYSEPKSKCFWAAAKCRMRRISASHVRSKLLRASSNIALPVRDAHSPEFVSPGSIKKDHPKVLLFYW